MMMVVACACGGPPRFLLCHRARAVRGARGHPRSWSWSGGGGGGEEGKRDSVVGGRIVQNLLAVWGGEAGGYQRHGGGRPRGSEGQLRCVNRERR